MAVKVRRLTFVPLVIATAIVPIGAAPDGVRIAAIVTDHQGRSVPGLTVKDFELREDGVPQKIDLVEARRPAPRQLAILLDEFHVAAADGPRVRDAVSALLDGLRHDDAVVVLKPLDPLTTIRLSADLESARAAAATFEGRLGNYQPRTPLEEETLGRAPALVEAGRAQVVLSALRALTAQLGSRPGRPAILLVSEGFTPQPQRASSRGLPDVGLVDRFANRYDVPIYAVDPSGTPSDEADAGAAALNTLATDTGGSLTRGGDLAAGLLRAAADLDAGYTIAYTPSHGDDGRYHPVRVTLARRVAETADARARAGYVSQPSAEMRRAMRAAIAGGPILPTRLLHRSPLVDVWSGVTRMTGAQARVAVTWEPGRPSPSAGKSSAARVTLKATTADGTVLYEGMLAPARIGEAADAASPDRAEFDAPAGRVQLDMTIVGLRGEKLDVDARDLEVPASKDATPIVLPAIVIPTQSAREFRQVTADASAAPDPSREFRRTDRLVIRVPAYAAGEPVRVEARLLNRLGQSMREIDALPDAPSGVTQFDLSLAPLAPGDYFLLFTVAGPSGPVNQRVGFKITG